MKKIISALAVLGALSAYQMAPAQTVVIDTDFEADQSSNFTVQNGAGDYTIDFSYDFSAFAQSDSGFPTSIPQSPNTPSGVTGTTALHMTANNNDATAAADAVVAYVNSTGPLAEYTLKFDAWINYNGGAGGGSGSTEFILWGVHGDSTLVAWPESTDSAGAFMMLTGESGAAQDARYYSSDSGAPTRDDTVPNWFGTGEISYAGANWLALFPDTETAGAPGKSWVVVETIVNGNSITVYVKPEGGTRQVIANFAATLADASGQPFVGYSDLFSSVANPAVDNFLLIDNLSVIIPPEETAATTWSLYN
jgi:hypothetical protein